MKFRKYIIALVSITAALVSFEPAKGCWTPYHYTPKGYYMYRVVDKTDSSGSIFTPFNPNAEDNCREWQRYSSKNIALTEIYQVVYKMTPNEYCSVIYDQLNPLHTTYKGNNRFLQWLCEDSDAAKYLLIAKTNEHIRSMHNSRWYYPTMETGYGMTLEDIVEYSLSQQGTLRERYLLQAVRAMFTLRRYTECVDLWNSEIRFLSSNNIMRRMILPYIAGAEYHLKNYKNAVSLYHEAGDYYSMVACSGEDAPKSIVETIERIYQYEPNCSYFPVLLQELVREGEPEGCFYGDWKQGAEWEKDLITDEHRSLARLAVWIAQEGKSKNPALWYYTAAYIQDLDGYADKASKLLSKAEQAEGTQFIKESVRIMRIYLDAKLMRYDSKYEQHLFGELQWLDKKIEENLTPQIREQTSKSIDLIANKSYYYWNDMLRRILLSEVCPRMVRSGKKVRALQLANMADNRLRQLVDYRAYGSHWGNSFFELIDSLGVEDAIAYKKRIEKPLSQFDSFLNRRGYVDMDYINDIIGTKMLRNMEYGKAALYFGKISLSFSHQLHTSAELAYDPFSYEQKEIDNRDDFKYRFACEMSKLEREIEITEEPNRKALAILRFACGIRNSFDRCWPLTQYYRGTWYWWQVQVKRDWENEPPALRAKALSLEMIHNAIALFTDKELAAQALYQFSQYRTVAEKYPQTSSGKIVLGHCDLLKDYAIR